MAIIMDKGLVAPSPPKIEATLESQDTKEGEYVQLHADEVFEKGRIEEETH